MHPFLSKEAYLKAVDDEFSLFGRTELTGIPRSPTISMIGLLHKWLHECNTKRNLCQTRLFQNYRIPTRLIYLGTDDQPELILRETNDLDPQTQYMTLSHCWGPKPLFKLLLSNYEALKEGIPEKQLTNTFIEATALVRFLGIEYLWIDSLCIIQDSVEDWLHESGLMGGVYQNSFCNLSATFVADGSAGLMRQLVHQISNDPQDPLNHKHKIVGVRTEVAFSVTSWLSQPIAQSSSIIPPGSYEWIDPQVWKREITDSAAGRRGWIVQERILARRVIHYCKRNIFWECLESQASSRYHDGLPEIFREEASLKLDSVKPWLELKQKAGTSPVLDSDDGQSNDVQVKAFMAWRRMVEMYSGTQLTQTTDKLIAISGLVYELLPLIKGEYRASMWSYRFIEQLPWITRDPVAKAASYQAPSWSWASVNSSIELYCWPEIPKDKTKFTLLTVLNFRCELIDVNEPYKGVKSATLKLKGNLIPAKWMQGPVDDNILLPASILNNCTLEAQGKEFWHHRDVTGDVPPDVYILPVYGMEDEDGEVNVFGIILEPT